MSEATNTAWTNLVVSATQLPASEVVETQHNENGTTYEVTLGTARLSREVASAVSAEPVLALTLPRGR